MLGVARERGLAEADVRARAARFGPNRLRQIRRKSALAILADQFASRIVALLAGAAALSLAFGRPIETLAIVVVLALNGAIGFWSELGAVRSMEALRRLGSVRARVRRAGRVESVDAAALVPGDVVVLEGGDVVTADLRLLEASRLEADESLLTGESLPVAKSIDPCAADAPVAERRCMLFKGTAVTRGAGEAVVVATGMATELGRISRLVEEAEDEITPLEKRLDRLGERLIWLTLAIAAGIGATALSAGKDWLLTVETAIALAVATVPEGLPIIATLALARGMHRMARRNALVNRLSAVEALGATGIIFTDKTGTLTENRMTVVALALATGPRSIPPPSRSCAARSSSGSSATMPRSRTARPRRATRSRSPCSWRGARRGSSARGSWPRRRRSSRSRSNRRSSSWRRSTARRTATASW
jgi:Ca2+-transporting ATPase